MEETISKRLIAVQLALRNHGTFSKGEPIDSAVPNVVAGIIGIIVRETMQEQVGDSIDRGLILVQKLNEVGLNVSFNHELANENKIIN